MDPVGFAASLLTLVSAFGKLGRLIKSMHNAPDELIALSNEVADLKIVLSDVEMLDRETNLVRTTSESLTKLLISARIKLNNLDKFVDELINIRPDDTVSAQRIKWAVSKRKKAKELQEELRDIRINLGTILAARSTQGNYSVQVILDQVSFVNSATSQRQGPSQRSGMAPQRTRSTTTPDTGNGVKQQVTFRNAQLLTEQANLMKGESSAESIAAAAALLDQVMDHTSRITSAAQDIEELHERFQDLYAGILPDKQASHSATEEESAPLKRAEVSTTQILNSTHAIVRVHTRQRAGCSPDCPCTCHQKHRIQSANFLTRIVGKLFVGYSGRLVGSSCCSEPSCRNSMTLNLQATYIFPRWFLAKAMALMAWQSRNSALTIVVKIRNYATDQEPFRRIAAGDFIGLEYLIHHKRISPNDLEVGRGQTLLDWAVDRGRIDMCKLLLDAGADPEIEDDHGRAPVHLARERFLGGLPFFTPEILDALKSMFWEGDGIDAEELDLPVLHRIILGLEQGSLEDELKRPEVNINAQDRLGYTAISWAAQRNNNDALRLLLQYRADPDIPDFEHCTPLGHATFTKDPSSLQILLHSRVDVSPDKQHGFTALHHAAYHHNDLGFIEPLLVAGCELDLREWGGLGGQTALSRTALKDRDIVAAHLIARGADVNNVDKHGDSIVSTAIQTGSNKVLALLLNHSSIDYTRANARLYTVLHTAADFRTVNLETLEILRRARLKDLDIHARNQDGFTALDLLQAREGDVTDEFRATFEALLDSVEAPPPSSNLPRRYGPFQEFEYGRGQPITLL
ncbi:MAG: hypothetical protein M1819_004497 [Sarea resinae]|nr:MAG: hypothetical protein M1819_004497 [Sarea resinae]